LIINQVKEVKEVKEVEDWKEALRVRGGVPEDGAFGIKLIGM
jgi:hypothetical protein